MNPISNNKRIAKNSLFLYLRLLLNVLIGLYTTRIVLQTLGVEDYGIYSVISGVINLISFLSGALNSATMRFLTYGIGEGDKDKISKIFSASLSIHIALSVFIFVVGGCLGLLYVYHYLVIPINRLNAAAIVYIFSLLYTCINVIQIPYNSLVIAHENLDIYAYISLFESLFKLLIVYLLIMDVVIDKLVFYSMLILISQCLVTLIYRYYCKYHYRQIKFCFFIQKEYYKPILSFLSLDIYGNMCAAIWFQGANLILNAFWGPVVNAAYGIYNQVIGVVGRFIDSFLMAVKPQLIKKCAEKENESMISLMMNASKFSFLLMLLIGIPFLLEANYLFSLWLEDIPPYSVLFTQLGIVYLSIMAFIVPINTCIHATGHIKEISFKTGTIYLLPIPIILLCYNIGAKPYIVILSSVIIQLVSYFYNISILKKYILEFSLKKYFRRVIVPCILIFIISSFPTWFIASILEEGVVRCCIVCIVSSCLILFSSYYIALNVKLRSLIIAQIQKNLKRKCNEII